MNYSTGICANCGADKGLHHFGSMLCPKNGIEEPNLTKPQLWEQTTFEDTGIKKLHDAAPDLLEALIIIQNNFNKDGNMTGHLYQICESAIKKATE